MLKGEQEKQKAPSLVLRSFNLPASPAQNLSSAQP